MEKNSFTFQASDGTTISALAWTSEKSPKAIVQIAHGMAEHIGRYAPFAEELVKHDIFVYGNDHRGHGKTASSKEDLGYFDDEHGFEKAVDDLLQLSLMIRKTHPETPMFLMGHSMGSFLARRYIQLYGEQIEGVILSGTGGDPGFLGKVGTILAAREARKKGRKTKSPLLNKLSFGSFNKSFKPNRTAFDWLSRDPNEVDKYIADPLCGNISTAGFFHDLFVGLREINRLDNIQKVPKDLPIYLFSGDKDPVGNNAKGVVQTYNTYLNTGIKNVTYKLYPEGRHEMLNEINKEEVYKDILAWINAQLKQ